MDSDILIIKKVPYSRQEVKEYFATHDIYECVKKFNCVPSYIYRFANINGFRVKRRCPHRPNQGNCELSLCYDKCPITSGIICPWLNDFTPVKGWEAEETTHKNGETVTHSYLVKKCPIYDAYMAKIEKEGKRK